MPGKLIDTVLVGQIQRLHRFAMVALCLIAGISITGATLTESKSRWLLHTRNVLRVLNNAEREVNRVVDDGVLVDGAFPEAITALAMFDSLAVLTADNPQQQARITTARAAAVARLDAAAAHLARTANAARPDAPERRALAESVMHVREAEQRLYDERSSSQRYWRYVMVSLLLSALGIVAIALQRFRRSTISGVEKTRGAMADRDEAQRQLAFLLERAPVAVAIVDGDGRLAIRNAQWERLVGPQQTLSTTDVAQQPVVALVARMVTRVRTSGVLDVEEFTVGDAGTLQTWTATAYLMDGVRVDSTPVDRQRVGVLLMDVTEHRALETRLRHSQRLESIGRLSGGVAHDFNNILTAILGFTEIVQSRMPGDGRLRDDLTQVTRAAERAAILTRQLLSFSRQQVVQPRALDLGEVVRTLEPMLRRLIGSHIVVRVEGDGGLWAVHADRGQLEQVIVNLVLNARDALPNGGDIVITTHNVQKSDGHRCVALTVRDNGVGIPEADRARIFDAFFTTKAPGQGTGLGLATVRGIVQQCEGTITVESAEGRGTQFTVTLPFHDGPVEEALRVVSTHAVPRHAELLVVDDDRDVRQLMEYALTEAGYRVVSMGNGHDALAYLRRVGRAPDLVISDLVMPGAGGYELARQVAADGGRIPFLFVSGYAQEQHNALTTGPASVIGARLLTKPFTPSELVGAVNEALERGVIFGD